MDEVVPSAEYPSFGETGELEIQPTVVGVCFSLHEEVRQDVHLRFWLDVPGAGSDGGRLAIGGDVVTGSPLKQDYFELDSDFEDVIFGIAVDNLSDIPAEELSITWYFLQFNEEQTWFPKGSSGLYSEFEGEATIPIDRSAVYIDVVVALK